MIDALLEDSTYPSAAVSALAALALPPPFAPNNEGEAPALSSASVSAPAEAQDDPTVTANKRQAMTVEALRAREASSRLSLDPPVWSGGDGGEVAEARGSGVGGGSSSDSVELEKVAAFICNYAGASV